MREANGCLPASRCEGDDTMRARGLVSALLVAADPTLFAIRDGRLYVFRGAGIVTADPRRVDFGIARERLAVRLRGESARRRRARSARPPRARAAAWG